MDGDLRPFQVRQPRLPMCQQVQKTRVGGGCAQNVLLLEENGAHVPMIVEYSPLWKTRSHTADNARFRSLSRTRVPSPRVVRRCAICVSGCGGRWSRPAVARAGAVGADWEQWPALNGSERCSTDVNCAQQNRCFAGRLRRRWSARCRPSVHTGEVTGSIPVSPTSPRCPLSAESADRGHSSYLFRGPSPRNPTVRWVRLVRRVRLVWVGAEGREHHERRHDRLSRSLMSGRDVNRDSRPGRVRLGRRVRPRRRAPPARRRRRRPGPGRRPPRPGPSRRPRRRRSRSSSSRSCR